MFNTKEELLDRRKLLCQEANELEEDLRLVEDDIDAIDNLLEEMDYDVK